MRTAGSILLILILVPASFAIFLVLSLQSNVVTATFVKSELARRQIYALAEDQVAKQIATIKLENLPITADDLQKLANRVFPASWLQTNVEGILDHAFFWFNAPNGTALSLPINLVTPKNALIPGVDALIASAIPRLPACTKQNEGQLCQQPGFTVAQVKEMLKEQGIDLETVTSQLPNSIDLANPVLPSIQLGNQEKPQASDGQQSSSQNQLSDNAGNGSTSTDGSKKPVNDDEKKKISQQETDKKELQNDQQKDQKTEKPKETIQQQVQHVVAQLEKAKASYHQALMIWWYVLIGYSVLIFGYLLLNANHWHRFVRWAGILALAAGMLPLCVSVASAMVLKQTMLPRIDLHNAPVAVQTAVPAAIMDVQHALFFPILFVSAALVILGLAAIIGAHWLPQPKKKGSK